MKSRPSLVNGKAEPDAGGQMGRYRKEESAVRVLD